MALLLAFDTATRHLAVVLSENGTPLNSRIDESEQFSHAEKLNVFVAEVLTEAGRSLADLDAIAVGIGPGSYTGLRIGTSAAKGLCFALDKPLIGMSTLEVLVQELRTGPQDLSATDVLFPMIDARRMEVFTRAFRSDGAPEEGSVTHPAILDEAWCERVASAPDRRVIVFGDGADKAKDLWTAVASRTRIVHVPGIRPSVLGLATCADVYFQGRMFADLAYLVPDYGKPANVTSADR